MKYTVIKISIKSPITINDEIETDNIKEFKKELCKKYRVKDSQIKLTYEERGEE